VSLLVELVDVGIEGLEVQLRLDGLGGLTREMIAVGLGEGGRT
jgi:site-specific DNA recombinase